MSSPSYRVLGPLEVTVADTVVDLGGPKQRAVLGRLLIDANRVVSMDRLIEDLWGDDPPATATATLQAYVSNLRRVLEPNRAARAAATVLVSRPPGYVLETGPDDIDAARFERLAETGMAVAADDPVQGRLLLAEALDLWRGSPLSDFTYEPFASSEIARLEELRITSLEERIAAELLLGRSGELVAELEHLVAAHPLRERLWSQLMLSLYRSGRQAEALRAYRRHAHLLGEELGIEPSAELRRLEQAMLDQDPSLLTIPSPRWPAGTSSNQAQAIQANSNQAPSNEPHSDQPRPQLRLAEPTDDEVFRIVGRQRELDGFAAIIAEASRGRGGVVLIEGEPGIGKSRLLEAMQRRAMAAGLPAVLARCVEVGRTPAFWPWVQTGRELLSSLGMDAVTRAAGPYAATLAPFFPDLTPAGRRPAPPDLAPHAVAEAVLHTLRALTTERPLVILIDDLYAADPDSLSVLALMSAEVERLGLVLVGSYRTTDVPADHPLAETLAQLSRQDRVERMQLRRLSADETGDLVRQVTGDVSSEVVQTIHDRTDGNAFFTVELARLLSGDGMPATESLAEAIPTGVRDVIRRRLARLGEQAVGLLRVAAVCGRRWDLAVVTEVHEMDLGEALDVVDDVVGSGLVVEDERAGWYRFSHVLIADTVVDSLNALRRARLHGQVAAILERTHGDDPTYWVEIAHHAVEAVPVTGKESALLPLGRAGRHAVASNAIALGEQLCQERLDLALSMPPSPTRDLTEMEALLDLGTVWTWREGYHSERLGRASARVLELASVLEDREKGTEVVLHGIMGRYSTEIVGGRIQDAMDTATFVLGLAEANPDTYTELIGLVMTVVAGLHLPDFPKALSCAPRIEEILRIVEPDEDGSVLLPLDQQAASVTFREFYASVLWMAGDRDAAYEQLARTRRIAERSNHPYTVAFAASVEVVVAAYDKAHDMAASAVKWVRELVDTAELGVLHAWLDIAEEWARLVSTNAPVDTGRLRSMIGSVEERGALVVITLFWGIVAELELASRRPEAALDAVERGLAYTAVPGGERFWYAELERLNAQALTMLGRREEAASALERAEQAAISADQPYILARIKGS